MPHYYSRPVTGWLFTFLLLWLAAGAAQAQAPAWDGVAIGRVNQVSGTCTLTAVTTDASGNVFVTGSFRGVVALGNILLSSAGQEDLLVAKYVPATSTWAWAQRGGGTGVDYGTSIAVNNSRVYVAGAITNNTSNASAVRFGGSSPASSSSQVNGASATVSADLLLAMYTDNGATATLGWTQVGGGTSGEKAVGVAVSSASVYVTGTISNDLGNTSNVLFGGNGTTPGTTQVNGASTALSSDLLLAKYTDNGTSATLGWTQVGGGISNDNASGIAVQGLSVYITGTIQNNSNNANAVVFGGGGTTAGTTPVSGAGATIGGNLLLAKYTDNGNSGTLGWTRVGGGATGAAGKGVAVSGSSVYVTGTIFNDSSNTGAIVFSSTAGAVPVYGASATLSDDVVLAKYTDQGSTAALGWTQVGGGIGTDYGNGVAVEGTSVYVTGFVYSDAANSTAVRFGGGGTTPGTVALAGVSPVATASWLLAKYTDQGSTGSYQWGRTAGRVAYLNTTGSDDASSSVAVRGSRVYVLGRVGATPSYSFGSANTTVLQGTLDSRSVLAIAADNGSAGDWVTVASPFSGGGSLPFAMATDASGNVFVTGSFNGQLYFDSTLLTSAGDNDIFVAKYVPATATWAWAVRGGGERADEGYGIAVSGSSVYVTGYYTNNLSNGLHVSFAGTGQPPLAVNGAGSVTSKNLVLAKYTDQGNSAALNWTQVGGGNTATTGYGVAVNGPSVYVTGSVGNNASNTAAVLFGGNGTTPGTTPVAGATATSGLDLLLARYTDNGATATLGWVQVAGGTSSDEGYGVAVSGTSVYVTGYLTNNTTNARAALFGGDGTAAGTYPQAGASAAASEDLVLAKYTDTGSAGSYQWSQVGGGTANAEAGNGVALSNGSVYVTGTIFNNLSNANAVVFGGAGTTAGTRRINGASATASQDLVLAKYTDTGSAATLGWTQVGGGSNPDGGSAVVAGGGAVYVAGYIYNTLSNSSAVVFGGNGITAGTVTVRGTSATADYDLLVARYSDQGSAAVLSWAQVGGGPDLDFGTAIAMQGQHVHVAGLISAPATFGPVTLTAPLLYSQAAVATLTDPALPLPTRLAQASPNILMLYPNPSSGVTTLAGAAPGTGVQVLDALGRVVATATTDATGTAALRWLPTGLYLVRAGAATARLAVE